ncbi:MAG: hypothetical protein Q27BPR15_19685 [Rhodobacter sp. CACIA14H1]|nr:MAG: hypothetical protein Q27BPR15_19685 [Rhodobacter sp. CACIA14H1]
MGIDRAAILRRAWAWAKADAAFTWVYDWTPGATYGQRRATTAAERRAVFAKHLRAAWANHKAAVTRAAVPSPLALVATADLRAEVVTLENSDARLGWARQERISTLRRELAQRAA